VVKVAIHSTGFIRTVESTSKKPVSVPRTVLSDGDEGLRIPTSSAQKLRAYLRKVYPELAEKPFAATRLCWWAQAFSESAARPDRVHVQVYGHPRRDVAYRTTSCGQLAVLRHRRQRSCLQGWCHATSTSRIDSYPVQFFPVLGGLVADALEGKLDPALAQKFAVDRVFDHGDLSRPAEKPHELLEQQLCTHEDLEP
jgi:sarcosine oxidase/L-pipecolate oxidase